MRGWGGRQTAPSPPPKGRPPQPRYRTAAIGSKRRYSATRRNRAVGV